MNVVSLDAFREQKANEKVNLRANWILGEPTGSICPHCGSLLKHAILEPHGIVGQGCGPCEVWFSGKDDLPK